MQVTSWIAAQHKNQKGGKQSCFQTGIKCDDEGVVGRWGFETSAQQAQPIQKLHLEKKDFYI
jgi:hypothetical protein